MREEYNLKSARSCGLQTVCEEVEPPLLDRSTLVKGFDLAELLQSSYSDDVFLTYKY